MAASQGILIRRPAHERGLPPILAFAIVGSAGFVVDAGMCKALILSGLPPLAARVPSMLLGIGVTFWLNRGFTFRAAGPIGPQALRYGAVNAAGAAFNYAVFAVALLATHGLMPIGALIAGCGAGFAVNFLGARNVAFPPAERR